MLRPFSDASASHSDRELMDRARIGDDTAVAELWSRHRDAAVRAARAFTDLEAEDLVSDAYAAILEGFRRGGGPAGEAFRPYLYTVVRNLARRRGAARREVTVAELPEPDGVDGVAEQQLGSLDQQMIRTAFASLPKRWQEVLWYTEVERLSPREIAPILGVGANATAALAYRAREALRQAWLQEHIAAAREGDECGWVLAHLGEHSRDGLGRRAADRADAHLAGCRDCRDAAMELRHVNRQLASMLMPAILGGGAAVVWWQLAPVAPAAAAAAGAGLGTAALGGLAAIAATVGLLGGLGLGPAAPPAAADTPTGPASAADAPPSSPSLPGLVPFVPPAQTVDAAGPAADVSADAQSAAAAAGDVGAAGEGGLLQQVGDVVTSVVATGGSAVNAVTGAVGDLASAATGGLVGLDVSTDLGAAAPSASVGVDVGGAVSAGVTLGGDQLLDVDLGVGDLLSVTVGGDGGLLGLGILGKR